MLSVECLHFFCCCGFRITGRKMSTADPFASIETLLQASDFRFQASGFRLQASGLMFHVSGFRLQASGFKLQASGLRF